MKRIAAVAALLVTMLAVPAAAAMASTVGSGSGPAVAPAEEFSYDGSTYTIWSINPGDDSFTMSVNGSLYVNGGPDINDATGNLFCSG